jgi:hypothetical protein
LTLLEKSIEKAQNVSETARRAEKTVKNQDKWPKIGLEEPEGLVKSFKN